jgi:FHS family Na+ dependent glucose MFS transporter 1
VTGATSTDRRPDTARQGRVERTREATAWLGYLSIGFALNLLGPALPALRGLLGEGYGQLGLLFAAGAVGSGVSTLLGNRWLDRLGYRRLLVGASATYALAMAAAAAVPLFALWLIALALGGLSASAVDIAGARYVAQARGDGASGALNLLNAFYALGGVLAPAAVAALVAAGVGPRPAFVLAAAVLALGAGLALATMAAAAPPRAGEATALAGWRWALAQPALVRLALLVGVYVGCEVAFAGWVTPYARAVASLPLAVAATFPILFWTCLLAGRSLAAAAARAVSESRLIAAGLALAAAGVALALSARIFWALAVATALVGLGYGPIFPTAFALAARHAPSHRSESYALLFVGGATGSLTLPWLAGQLFAAWGPRAAASLVAAGTLAMAAAFVAVVRRGPPRSPRLAQADVDRPGPGRASPGRG